MGTQPLGFRKYEGQSAAGMMGGTGHQFSNGGYAAASMASHYSNKWNAASTQPQSRGQQSSMMHGQLPAYHQLSDDINLNESRPISNHLSSGAYNPGSHMQNFSGPSGYGPVHTNNQTAV